MEGKLNTKKREDKGRVLVIGVPGFGVRVVNAEIVSAAQRVRS